MEFPLSCNEEDKVTEKKMLETSTVFAPGDGFDGVPRIAEMSLGCVCDEDDIRLSVPATQETKCQDHPIAYPGSRDMVDQ